MGEERGIASALDMLYISACVLAGEVPKAQKLSGTDLKRLYDVSKFHSLSALVCEGIESFDYKLGESDKSIMQSFCTDRDMSVRKNLLLDFERSKLLSFFEAQGIWYMPLKGVVLKDMYPKMGLRQMADNDILFDESYRADVRAWFCEQGYKAESFGISNVDEYTKAPVYNYEMHVSLFDDDYSETKTTYYKDVKKRLVRRSEKNCSFDFTDEDFYIFFIAHAQKHFEKGGIGVRFLCDLYVYLKAKSADMDFSYIESELEKLELTDFECDFRELCAAVFSDVHGFCFDKLPQKLQQRLLYLISSGTYGTLEQKIKKGFAKYGKLGYLLLRIFPGTKVMKSYHPAFGKRWLLPVGWVYRAFVILFTKSGYALRVISSIIKTKRK